jgi:BirA family biotin operon repressor/biotin-[acetyl-CoA-carboxylase] ligase
MAAGLIAEETTLDGTVVYTDHQVQGKGQRGNTWESAAGQNLTLSIIFETKFLDPDDNFLLTQITSLAIMDLLKDYVPVGLKIKWPNDIVYFDQKIAGILIENYIQRNRIEWSIVGIGLNINQHTFVVPEAVSLARICNQTFNRHELLSLLLQAIEKRYFQLKRLKYEELRVDYLQHLYWRNEIHVFQNEEGYFNGRIVGVNKRGNLHIKLEDGDRFFDLKELKFIR